MTATPEMHAAAEPALAEALAAAQRADWSQAMEAIGRALEIAPASAEVHLARGRVLRARGGDPGAAIRAFRRAFECEGATPARCSDALYEYGLLLGRIGRQREAGQAFERAIAIVEQRSADGEPGLEVRLAELADLAGRADEVDGLLESALERHRLSETYYRQELRDVAGYCAREATLLERLGRYRELFACYRRLVDVDPDRVLFAHPHLKRSTAAAARLKGLLHGINDYLAREGYDLVATVFKAGFFYRLGRYRQAVKLVEKAIARGPEHFYAYHLLGKVHLKAGRPSAALEALERAVPLAPGYYDLERDLALALELTGRERDALDAYRHLETTWPGRTDTLSRAAALRERLGEKEEAYECFRRLAARTVAPDLALLERLADLVTGLGRPHDAIRHLEEAIALAPPGTYERANLRIKHAAALVASNRGEQALRELSGMIERCEARGQAGVVRAATLEKAALLHRHLGRWDEALQLGNALLRRDPADAEALLLCGDALKSARRFQDSVEYYSRAADQQLAHMLLDEGVRLHEGAQYRRAIGKLHEAFRKSTASWEIYYCAATAYARLGEAAPCARYLEAAARQQPGALELMEKDRDFDKVREAPALRALLDAGGAASG